MIAITFVIYWGMIYLTKKIENKYNEKTLKQTNYPILDSAMAVLAATSQQGEFQFKKMYLNIYIYITYK